MKYLAMAVAAMLSTGCVSHKMVEEDPLDFPSSQEENMKLIAQVKETPRGERRHGRFGSRRDTRQVAGMSYFITRDKIPGNLNFQYRGENGSVSHTTRPERKKASVSKRRAVRTVYKTKVDRKDAEILKALQSLNRKLDKEELGIKLDRQKTGDSEENSVEFK